MLHKMLKTVLEMLLGEGRRGEEVGHIHKKLHISFHKGKYVFGISAVLQLSNLSLTINEGKIIPCPPRMLP